MQAVAGGPSWTARLARALGLDGNPLLRASDRAEAWIRAGLLVVFFTIGPMAALAAGQWTAHAADAGTTAQAHAVQVTGAPQPGGWTSAAVLTAVMTLAVTALTLLTLLRLIERFLDWRRLAAWEAAWRATGPRWTGHRS